ncbi:MAG: GWxTD domain-containing protein [Acidobacteriota bacterium]
MLTRTFTFLVCLTLAALPATAEISQRYVDWAEGPARHLFTKADRQAWEGLASDQQAEDFIRLFWAQRDPTPDSAENEFQREFERRSAYADERFTHLEDEVEVRGSVTDRGRVFLMLGPPRRLQQPGASGSTGGGTLGGDSAFGGDGNITSGGGSGRFGRGGTTDRFGVASEEVWIYEKESLPEVVTKKRLRVRFRTKPGTEEVKLHQGEEALAFAAEAAERAIKRPQLVLADLAPATTTSVLAVEGESEFRSWGASALSDAAALEDLRAALSAGEEMALKAHLDTGAFQSSEGEWIVPLQVSSASPPDGAVLIGELVDADGESRVSFEVPGEWKDSKGQKLLKATVVAPPGQYQLRAGLRGSGGDFSWCSEQAVEVPSSQDELWISELILSDNIFPMREAQNVLEPYAWQGVVVVPKGDRSFAQGGVLWYYLHACQPALDDNGQPRLRLSVQLSGASSFRGPAAADPVKAGDNCWVLAQGLDLTADRFVPGDYELKVNVRDSVAKKTLVSSTESFTVVNP